MSPLTDPKVILVVAKLMDMAMEVPDDTIKDVLIRENSNPPNPYRYWKLLKVDEYYRTPNGLIVYVS